MRIEERNQAKTRWSPAQRAAIAGELEHVLAHPVFRSSNRCSELMSRLASDALAGQSEGAKERTLGVEVFGREADYDTNADPIVRRTANEIRKRLAQYYQELQASCAVRMQLGRGSYQLEFEFVEASPAAALPAGQQPEAQSAVAFSLRRRLWGWAALAVALLLAAALPLLWRHFHLTPQDALWRPLLHSGAPVIVCLSDNTPLVSGDPVGAEQMLERMRSNLHAPPAPMSSEYPAGTPFMDARVAHAIAARLWQYRQQTSLQPSSALKPEDFRHHSAVLIGGTNNPWALTLLPALRYTVKIDPQSKEKWIEDAWHREDRAWRIEGSQKFIDTRVDYAVITRYFEQQNGQWILALSGLEAYATEAASELLTNPDFGSLIPAGIGASGNFQMVLQTTVVNGSPGQLRVLAVHTW